VWSGGTQKRLRVGAAGVGKGRILLLRKSILLFLARAGLTKVYLFFFRLIGLEEFK
jgi:hypothetical protein